MRREIETFVSDTVNPNVAKEFGRNRCRSLQSELWLYLMGQPEVGQILTFSTSPVVLLQAKPD